MKTKNLTYIITTLFAYLIACSVLLAHTHAADLVKHSLSRLSAPVARIDDMHAKVMGDMHTHIDKTTLKNIADSTPARRRDLDKDDQLQEPSLLEQLSAALLMFRITLTMPVSVYA
jgi:hypothetical protein